MAPLPLLLLAALAGASRLHHDAETMEVSSAAAERAARAAAWANQTLRGRYLLLEMREDFSPRYTGDFPWGEGATSPLSRKHFEAPSQLGRGAYGEAWSAFDLERRRKVVVKIPHAGSIYVTKAVVKEHPEVRKEVKRSEEECSLVQRMVAEDGDYPEGKAHICECIASHATDQVREDDVVFLVLEDCGKSLRQLTTEAWQRWPRWSPKDEPFARNVRKWMHGVFAAVRFMSGLATPMIHMDIHWDNIVITEDGTAKLIDFGLAQPYDQDFPEVTHTRAPPENPLTRGGWLKQYPKEKAWAYDVWSTGAMWYETICGPANFPFRTEQAMGTFEYDAPWSICETGGKGVGSKLDWRVIEESVAPYEERKSPKELMAVMEQ